MSKEKKVKRRYRWCRFFEYTTLFLPYIIIIICRWEVYFTQKNAISMGIGMAMALAIAGIIVFKKTKILQGFGGLLVAWLFCLFLETMIADLMIITGYGALGAFVSMIFKRIADAQLPTLQAYKNKDVMTNG